MNSKALCGILMLVAGTAFCASTKEINFSFDPSRFTTEKKGDAVLFRYNDPRCKYVEHGAGAPVLPCIEVYVVMPKGATYTKCRTRVESLPLAGTYTLYTRESNADVLQYAKRYPERLVEYAGRRALGEYTLFTFRVYPMSCQPGDGSVARTLRVGLVVEYETADKGKYETVTAEQIVKVKSLVLNPDDVDAYTVAGVARQQAQAMDAAALRRPSIVPESSEPADRPHRPASADDDVPGLDRILPSMRSDEPDGGFDARIDNKVYINDDNRLALSVLQF